MTMSFHLAGSKLHRAMKQQVASNIANRQLPVANALPIEHCQLSIAIRRIA